MKEESRKFLQMIGVLSLGAAAVIIAKKRSESDEEVQGEPISEEKYLRTLSGDELERLILDARKRVYSARSEVDSEIRSNRLVKFDAASGEFRDCEGEAVRNVVAVEPTTERETKAFEECEEEVAAEKALGSTDEG